MCSAGITTISPSNTEVLLLLWWCIHEHFSLVPSGNREDDMALLFGFSFAI